MHLQRRTNFPAALALALVLACLGCVEKGREMPVAKHGVLDLSTWDIARDGPVNLDGQWEFYWDRLLTPEEFKTGQTAPEPTGYLAVPGSWRGFTYNGKALPGTGQATLRLRIIPGHGSHELVFRLFNIPAAYTIWANGTLLASSGVIGKDDKTEIAHRTLILSQPEAYDLPIDVVLQVSNHYFRGGGVRDSIVLAAPGLLELAHVQAWGWSSLLTGGLLFMGFYHLVLHYWRSKDASTLYFGFYCLILAVHFATSDSTEWIIYLFIPKVSPLLVENLSLVCYVCSASIMYRFYRALYPKEFPICLKIFCDFRSALFVFIILTQSGIIVFNALYYFMLSSFLLIGSYVISLCICLKRKRIGALFLLLGSVIMGLVAINDILCHMGTIKSVYLIQEGTFVFVLSQALALAQRFSNAFTEVEFLSIDLEGKNAELKTEMDERNRLEQEIIKVSEEERRNLSHDLHDGLCQQLAVARLRCSVLALEPGMGQDALGNLADLSALLNESVSHAYDLSRGLWPVEHDPKGSGPSLEELARRVGESSGIAMHFSQDLACASCGNPHLVQLYRIAQEAVTNAVKHAAPNRLSISLTCGPERKLTLSVCDDGVGWSGSTPSQGGLGLRIMAHRARMIGGELSISAAAQGGTVLVCSLLCPADNH